MLVLSRRPKEKIVLPAIHTTVEVLEVKGGRVRLGIDAPQHVAVLREEIADREMAEAPPPQAPSAAPDPALRKTRHELRNQLNAASVGLALARRQLEAGMVESVQITLDRIEHGFQALGEQVENLADRPGPERYAPSQPAVDRPTRRRALLVEDDDNECELLAGFLRLAGYEVVTAADGLAALEQLRDGQRPDVVLLDMGLPRCDGPTMLEAIRQDPRMEGLRVFAVTGHAPEDFGIDPASCGLNGWFQKPLNPERLLREVGAGSLTLTA